MAHKVLAILLTCLQPLHPLCQLRFFVCQRMELFHPLSVSVCDRELLQGRIMSRVIFSGPPLFALFLHCKTIVWSEYRYESVNVYRFLALGLGMGFLNSFTVMRSDSLVLAI